MKLNGSSLEETFIRYAVLSARLKVESIKARGVGQYNGFAEISIPQIPALNVQLFTTAVK